MQIHYRSAVSLEDLMTSTLNPPSAISSASSHTKDVQLRGPSATTTSRMIFLLSISC
ncbi:hypothetical protein M0657_008277 [Pyricularia oryzae]|uniref:Uncharacterized protein n=3 Tax=Pyricularia oryzae TaxID=318829 RepID=A0A4P7N6H3_PYROR|nr:hypothetical protein OOU_Y34scaffold00613g4 [Pyricularia oryzae Y34]KAI7917079.1 hypothetical protein M0657_008277 [Pyricularia oryzae]KAI7922423.1 hypothetical protein M9X92_004857 [Pyricularia oryzae]QBZ58197.1 hypothetical protein PoMZ_03141 [Pyricularia oryzae]